MLIFIANDCFSENWTSLVRVWTTEYYILIDNQIDYAHMFYAIADDYFSICSLFETLYTNVDWHLLKDQ